VLLGVAARDTEESMQDFVERHGLGGMDHIADHDLEVWDRYGIAYQPAWVFISPDGEVDVVAGALAGEGLAARLDELIAR
jgi:peroxiredoxin